MLQKTTTEMIAHQIYLRKEKKNGEGQTTECGERK